MTTTDPCPAFWPVSEQHGLRYIDLATAVTPAAAPLMPGLSSLAGLSDALRSIQLANGDTVSAAAEHALRDQIAAELEGLAEIADPDVAAVLSLRAGEFRGDATHAATAQTISERHTPEPITVLCGPLCTWRPKTRSPLHSLIAATADDPSDALIGGLDASLDAATAELERDLGLRDLAFSPVFGMEITNLIVCAGEADGHPKHYAYFLPEDEGIADSPDVDKRTLVFGNVYFDRYRLITEPLSDVLLDGPRHAREIAVERTLLTWLRGHDVAHSARLPATSYGRWHDGLGHEPFMMLQEALADVYGFLLANTRSWRDVSNVSTLDYAAGFMAESLHYVRRGPWHCGDAGAAYLELSYLAVNGFVDVGTDGTIRWELDRLCDGMHQLALELAQAILEAQDPRPPQQLIERYGWPATTPALQVLASLRWQLNSIPTTLAYRDARMARGASNGSSQGAAALAALVDWSVPARDRGLRIAS